MKKLLIILILISLAFSIGAVEKNFRQSVLLDNHLINTKALKNAIGFNIAGVSNNLIGLPLMITGGYYMTKTPIDSMKLIFSIGCTLFVTGLLFDLISVGYYVASGKPLREFKAGMKNKLNLKDKPGPNIRFGVRFEYVGDMI